MMKKRKIFITIAAVIAFTSFGFYAFKNGKQENTDNNRSLITIIPQPVTAVISLQGIIEPLHILNIISPINGRIVEKHFKYGDYVKKDQILAKIDASETEVKYHDTKAAYAKAVWHLEELEACEKNSDISRARRSIARAKLSLDAQKKKVENTKMLLDKGIIPASEYETFLEQYKNLQLDYQSAEDELKSALIKCSEKNKNIARLEAESARLKLKEVEDALKRSTVRAPISGIVLLPYISRQEQEEKKKSIEIGSIISRGEVMLSIGDASSLSVKTQVDEVEITKIKYGQKVRITGDAFPGIALTGKITHISSHAKMINKNSFFDIAITIDRMPPEYEKSIHIGMSANIEVVVYEKADAIMIPVSAVKTNGQKRRVNVIDKKTQKLKEVEVETGIITMESVEIIRGLKIGDTVSIR
jgi:multidrug efflux pump subunit AcrA (membrane-fusion protein)